METMKIWAHIIYILHEYTHCIRGCWLLIMVRLYLNACVRLFQMAHAYYVSSCTHEHLYANTDIHPYIHAHTHTKLKTIRNCFHLSLNACTEGCACAHLHVCMCPVCLFQNPNKTTLALRNGMIAA